MCKLKRVSEIYDKLINFININFLAGNVLLPCCKLANPQPWTGDHEGDKSKSKGNVNWTGISTLRIIHNIN